MSAIGRRLDRLATLTRPMGCNVAGGACWKNEAYGDGSDDPPEPDLPGRCPACGLPRSYRLIRVLGVDVGRI